MQNKIAGKIEFLKSIWIAQEYKKILNLIWIFLRLINGYFSTWNWNWMRNCVCLNVHEKLFYWSFFFISFIFFVLSAQKQFFLYSNLGNRKFNDEKKAEKRKRIKKFEEMKKNVMKYLGFYRAHHKYCENPDLKLWNFQSQCLVRF